MHTVVGSVRSRAARVVWLLEELGLPHDSLNAAPQSDLAFAYNVTGKLPVLIEGDARITDSTAILTYPADKPGAIAAPEATLACAQQASVTPFVLDEMDAEMTLPDIIATHCLTCGINTRFAAPEGHLVDYVTRMRARPAHARAMAS